MNKMNILQVMIAHFTYILNSSISSNISFIRFKRITGLLCSGGNGVQQWDFRFRILSSSLTFNSNNSGIRNFLIEDETLRKNLSYFTPS